MALSKSVDSQSMLASDCARFIQMGQGGVNEGETVTQDQLEQVGAATLSPPSRRFRRSLHRGPASNVAKPGRHLSAATPKPSEPDGLAKLAPR